MANIIFRETSNPTIPGSSYIKGSPLENEEVDANFKSLSDDVIFLNTNKINTTDATSDSQANKVVKRDASGNFSANVITVTDLNSTSDINLKENIEIIDDPMDTLLQLDGVSFNWKKNGDKSYGIIAQELEKVLPELVHVVDGYKMVSYIPIIAFLLQAVKKQQQQIDMLLRSIE